MKKLAALLLFALPTLAQISVRPPDAIIPVVGSTRGQSNANFKTELQMANGTDVPMSGWLILRPQNVAMRYTVLPHATLSYSDVVADLLTTGLGSMDVLADGGLVPAFVVRAYDDQPSGTTGVTVPLVPADAVLGGIDTATLIVPRDLVRYRFNIGVRAMSKGVTLEVSVRGATAVQRFRRTLTFDADHFAQQPGDLFAGTPLLPDDSITIAIKDGSAVVYATTVDNRTNDSSIQVPTRNMRAPAAPPQ